MCLLGFRFGQLMTYLGAIALPTEPRTPLSLDPGPVFQHAL